VIGNQIQQISKETYLDRKEIERLDMNVEVLVPKIELKAYKDDVVTTVVDSTTKASTTETKSPRVSQSLYIPPPRRNPRRNIPSQSDDIANATVDKTTSPQRQKQNLHRYRKACISRHQDATLAVTSLHSQTILPTPQWTNLQRPERQKQNLHRYRKACISRHKDATFAGIS
jgi:hypothetical protein